MMLLRDDSTGKQSRHAKFFLSIVSAAEYGSVICDGVPMADIPMELQESRVFQLKLRNNQMFRFPDAKLSGSGTQFLL